MTPILRPTAPRILLPSIDEEELTDENTSENSISNENVSPSLLQPRAQRSASITRSSTARAGQPSNLPPGTEYNTENSLYDQY